MNANIVGYARVSTSEQHPELQQDALREAGCDKIFTDVASGSLRERPELTNALNYLRPGDQLVVWRLDRLGRSLKNLIETVNLLQDRDIQLRSLHESIDTSTATGTLILHVFASLSEFEMAMLRERTKAGLEAARARGRKGGRPRVLQGDKLSAARQMHASGDFTISAISKSLGVSRATLYRHLSGQGL